MKTDSELIADVQAELDWDPSFDDRGIVVAAKGVAGVRTIANDIEVHLEPESQRTDREVAEAAVFALKSNVAIPLDATETAAWAAPGVMHVKNRLSVHV